MLRRPAHRVASLRESMGVSRLALLGASPAWEPPPLLLVVLAVAVILLAVQSARLWAARNRPRWRLERNRRKGAEGEILAERLLIERGYELEARQIGGRYELVVDGHPKEVSLRADFLVRRGGKRFVAEAKGGRVAARIDTIATRRQVLEYCIAFDVEGVLLVDARAGEISLVQLPRRGDPAGSARVLLFVFVLVLVAISIGVLWGVVAPG